MIQLRINKQADDENSFKFLLQAKESNIAKNQLLYIHLLMDIDIN